MMFVNKGNSVFPIRDSNPKRGYSVRVNGNMIISPLPIKVVLEKIANCEYNINGDFKRIYDSEKAIALENFIIDGPFDGVGLKK